MVRHVGGCETIIAISRITFHCPHRHCECAAAAAWRAVVEIIEQTSIVYKFLNNNDMRGRIAWNLRNVKQTSLP